MGLAQRPLAHRLEAARPVCSWIASATLAGIGLQPHAFACARCQRIRSSIFAPGGIRFFACHPAFVAMGLVLWSSEDRMPGGITPPRTGAATARGSPGGGPSARAPRRRSGPTSRPSRSASTRARAEPAGRRRSSERRRWASWPLQGTLAFRWLAESRSSSVGWPGPLTCAWQATRTVSGSAPDATLHAARVAYIRFRPGEADASTPPAA